MTHKTFPKERQKKLNETIRDLKAELKRAEKEIKFLRSELENLTKPQRVRKLELPEIKLTHEEWKVDFKKRFKKEVLGEP